MPTRRTTLAVMGTLVAGGTGAVATGAFSAATAERDVTVEFADDDVGLLVFDPTSDQAGIEGGDFGLTFEDLNQDTDFTFNDVFRIINDGTETIRFGGVSTSDDDEIWVTDGGNDEAGRVYVTGDKNQFQGSDPTSGGTPDDDYTEMDEEGVGRTAVDDANEIDLDNGDWLSFGFKLAGPDDIVGDWEEDDIPNNLQIEFGESSTES